MKNLKRMEQIEAELGRICLEKAIHPNRADELDARTQIFMQMYRELAVLPETTREIDEESERLVDKMTDIFSRAYFFKDGTMDDKSELKTSKIQDKLDILATRENIMEVLK